jgi:outer membrane protein assembly factor BamD (BamD/ComL family)
LPATDVVVTDEVLRTYESAVQSFESGDWKTAFDQFTQLPERDRTREYLMQFIRDRNYAPPVNWNGVIEMQSK